MDAGARAASVVAELLAFYGEPAVRRPPYLHGDSPMPDGTLVLRIALGRFASEGLEDIAPSERDAARLAALAFVRQVCLRERATHYQVLCMDPDASPDSIRECYHLLIALIHPDRHDAEWPAGAPQRANQAYAVLADAGQRAEYDRQLLKMNAGVGREAMRMAHAASETAPSRRRKRGGKGPILGRFAVVSGVVAALFIVQAWWVGGDVAPQHALLERAIPASERWFRQVLPDTPRFLGSAIEVGERLPPIEQPRRIASLGSWMPVLEAPTAAAAPVPGVDQRAATGPGPASGLPPVTRAVSTKADPPSPPVSLAQAAPPAATAPAAAPAAAVGPTRDQVEGLVAVLVGYYESGDADRLTELFDPDKLGFWSGYRTRTAYADFFGATRERRLRMDRLSWQANGAAAQARGEATVIADYADGRPRLERRIPVELDIVLREGKPRLSRLVLFPLSP